MNAPSRLRLVTTNPIPSVANSRSAKYSLTCGVIWSRLAKGSTPSPIPYSSAFNVSVPRVSTSWPSAVDSITVIVPAICNMSTASPAISPAAEIRQAIW